MKKSILIISFIVLIAFNVQTSFGYNITFEEWETKIQGIPTVCIIEPIEGSDKYLTETFVEKLMEGTRISIDEWETLLKQSEKSKDKSMWEINQIKVTVDEQEKFDYQECKVFIHFLDKPELEEEWYKVLGKTSYEQGSTGRTEIIVYYAGIEFCRTEDSKWIYYDPCYVDSQRIIQQLKSVIKHEFGHTIGLGHYVSDDIEVNIAWVRGQVRALSIMTVFTHQNFENNIITPNDIKKVRSIYGEGGFLLQTKEAMFHSFESPQKDFIMQDGDFEIVQINGVIDSKRFIKGIPIILEITKPDGIRDLMNFRVNSDGVFNMQKIIDSSMLNGTYFVSASYRGEKSDEITFNVINDKTVNVERQIPQWIKNNVGWWADGGIDDEKLIVGIDYLLKNGFMNIPDMPEQPKNQEYEVPNWIRSNAKWWSEGQITDNEYINGMQFLIKIGSLRHNSFNP